MVWLIAVDITVTSHKNASFICT